MNECAREIEWAGGKHVFNLNRPDVLAVLSSAGPKLARVKSGVLHLEPLKGQNGDTPAAALARFQGQNYSIQDVERVLLYGLWGGGMSLSRADELIAAHVQGRPIAKNALIAFEVLGALFIGEETA